MRGRPRPWLLLAVLLLVLAAYPASYGTRVLFFRRDRAEAQRALREYDFPAARVRLAACLRLCPSDAATRLLAARTARRDGDLAAAEEQLAACPAGEERALEWALLRAQRGQLQDVQPYLRSCLDVHHPARELILEALAWGSVQTYQLDQADSWVNELLAKAPRNPLGRLARAQTEESLGRDDRALADYRGVVADYPKYTTARGRLAALLLRTQKYEEAAAEYEELARHQPDQAVPLLGLARCWVRLERTEQARPIIQRLRQQYPDNSEVLLLCGQSALDEHHPAGAEPILRRAAALAPNDQEVQYQLAVCLGQLGRAEEARRHVERARQIEADLLRLEKAFAATVRTPTDPAPRIEAGRICLRNGQPGEALRWLNGALAVDPGHKPTHAALAEYFASVGDAEQAEHHRHLAGTSTDISGLGSRAYPPAAADPAPRTSEHR
jgi:Flp pilus assembly protein TadD